MREEAIVDKIKLNVVSLESKADMTAVTDFISDRRHNNRQKVTSFWGDAISKPSTVKIVRNGVQVVGLAFFRESGDTQPAHVLYHPAWPKAMHPEIDKTLGVVRSRSPISVPRG